MIESARVNRVSPCIMLGNPEQMKSCICFERVDQSITRLPLAIGISSHALLLVSGQMRSREWGSKISISC